MAYTQTDLDSVLSAITALVSGKRRTSATIGGDRIDYAPVDLPALRSLRLEIQSDISQAAGTRRTMLFSTGKGL